MEIMDSKDKPASPETVNGLIQSMHLTLVSSYKELFTDLRMEEVLKQDNLHGLDAAKKEYVDNVLRVHANVCYCNMCLYVQMRASLKAKLGVEKQFNIRRSVVTLHETYKYLYGFTEKQTLWQIIEEQLRSKYPAECEEIDDAASVFLLKYAQEEDGTLRDVSKHFSDNPVEFFQNMEKVTEKSVTERIAVASAFLKPLHCVLVQELKEHLGICHETAMAFPMPGQNVDISGVNKEKVEAIGQELERYSGIVNHLMAQLNNVQEISQRLNLDVTQNQHWKDLTENNIGLHILYIYIDTMVTFRAFIASESFAEIRQNLAYLILSAHEGFKKLYGFDESKRYTTYWDRAVKNALLNNGDEKARQDVTEIEKRLDDLSQSNLLQDEDMIVAFSHVGTIKKRKEEAPFLVLDYYRQPFSKDDMNVLTEFLNVMNQIVLSYNLVMDFGKRQIQQETDELFAGYIDKIDQLEKRLKEKTQDPVVLAKIEEMSNLMRNGLDDIKKRFS